MMENWKKIHERRWELWNGTDLLAWIKVRDEKWVATMDDKICYPTKDFPEDLEGLAAAKKHCESLLPKE